MSRIISIRRIVAVIFSTLALALAAPMASAGDPQIDAAKAAGAIGERIDGFVGIVDSSALDAATLRKVEELNAKRRAVYADLAAKQGVTVEQVARVTGEKLIENAPAGEFYLDEAGRWVKK